MNALLTFFENCLFGTCVPMNDALKKGKIKKIMAPSDSGLKAGNYGGVVVELRKSKTLKKSAKVEADAVKTKNSDSLVGIKKPQGKGKNKSLVTIAYAIVA